MPGFLYFVPHLRSLAPQQLPELGLGYALEDPGRKTVAQVNGGPEGLSGILFADPKRVDPGRCAYKPERQTWRKHHGKGFYVGLENGVPVGPSDLARSELLGGPLLVLGDDRRWQIPRARQWSGDDDPDVPPLYECCLDQALEMNDAGEQVPGPVLPRYAQLWAIATAYFHHCVGIAGDDEQQVLRGGAAELTLTSASVLAARVLSHNYALGIVECGLLKLLTKHNWRAILDAVIDWPSYDDLREKKMARRRASQLSSAGPADTPRGIDPPSPTSWPSPTDSTTSPQPSS